MTTANRSRDLRAAGPAPAQAYDRFMGHYLPSRAGAFADAPGIAAGMRVIDLGCGPGGLTPELAARVGVVSG